jgi:hypothetical protein
MSMPQPGPRIPPCKDCGGPRVGNLNLIGQTVGLHPAGKTVTWQPMSQINAVVCLQCGLTEIYAGGLENIREATQEHPEWFTW